ncbi:carboxylesterase family protein [Falsibacillus albus]|uniref:Phospholipase n=1 Tax=Falsibacillus albus TaxID=2478915 RepID=A0A3L7K0Q0_9BACI|nr:prolyl oligopeptidase family serine peptidase [Falsibacillus albus]RLQ96626.1 phospholipase [Falsibacillus albus]
MSQIIQSFQKDIQILKNVKLNYLLHVPKDYETSTQTYPLVLFLHGAGERGSDIEIVKRNGPPKLAEDHDFPFILVSPQCPLEVERYSNWLLHEEAVMALLDETISKFRIDESRIYLTGLSMGGYGTWEIGKKHADQFAAIAPICGGGSSDGMEALKDVPVWAFHGAKDDIVPIEESEQLVNELRQKGGNIEFTVYPEAGHDSWTETYSNPKFFEWLLSHSKK